MIKELEMSVLDMPEEQKKIILDMVSKWEQQEPIKCEAIKSDKEFTVADKFHRYGHPQSLEELRREDKPKKWVRRPENDTKNMFENG